MRDRKVASPTNLRDILAVAKLVDSAWGGAPRGLLSPSRETLYLYPTLIQEHGLIPLASHLQDQRMKEREVDNVAQKGARWRGYCHLIIC